MKARRTTETNRCFVLPGGNEDNDLWVQDAVDPGGHPVICSYWFPNDDEKQRIMNDEAIELIVWGNGHPPVALAVEPAKEYHA